MRRESKKISVQFLYINIQVHGRLGAVYQYQGAGTFQALEQILVLPWTENYEQQHLDYLAFAVRECAELLKK